MTHLYPWQNDDWARLQTVRHRPPQALLFKGTKGIGKFDLALQFAHSLLCQQPRETGLACGVCAACRWLSQGSHPDFRLLQPEALAVDSDDADEPASKSSKKASKQIKVEQIRDLADFFALSAHQGGRRVVVIHPAEAMNPNAANALLKNLEEPPPDLLFILVTHKSQQLLPTILSRCLAFPLTLPDRMVAANWLKQQGVAQPLQTLAVCGFAPLQARDDTTENELRDKLLSTLRLPARLDVFAIAEALQKTEQVRVVHWLQQWCYDLASVQLTGSVRYHLGDQALIQKLVASVDPLNLMRLQKQLQTARREAQHTLNPKLFFESLLLDYARVMGGEG